MKWLGIFAIVSVIGCASPQSGKQPMDLATGSSHDGGTMHDLSTAKDASPVRDSSTAADQSMQSLPDLTVLADMTVLPDLTTLPDLATDPDMTSCLSLPGACDQGLCIIACGACGKIGVCVNNVCTCL